MDKLEAETAWRRALQARTEELDALITTLRAENGRLKDGIEMLGLSLKGEQKTTDVLSVINDKLTARIAELNGISMSLVADVLKEIGLDESHTADSIRARIVKWREQWHVIETRAALAKQELEFHPDWSMLNAARDSLREHMALLRTSQERAAELEQWVKMAYFEGHADASCGSPSAQQDWQGSEARAALEEG